MGPHLRLGRVAGIEVGASWSLLAILALVTWALAGNVLAGAAPGAPAAARWLTAVVTAVAFLVGLLAHELAHAVVARAHGMEVEGITLWMFGGVSRLGGEPPSPRTELRMAAAGPLASLAIGVGAAAVAGVAALARLPDLVVAALAWLALVNVVLAVFNLLPAYPLDGGRVLRSVIWRRTGDLTRATGVAARIGVHVGYALIAVGVWLVLLGVGVSGAWTAAIGWVVLVEARSEQVGAELRGLLRDLRVADVMTPEPVAVAADVTVDELVRHHVPLYRCSTYPVVDPDGTPTGVVTLRALGEVPAAARAATPVGHVATPIDRVATARPDEPLVDLLTRLGAGRGRCALVVERGGLVGIVTATDIDRAIEVARIGGAAPTAGVGSRPGA